MLPKFEVAIESTDHFSLEDENVQAVIRAKYTHGQPMRGTAVMSITETGLITPGSWGSFSSYSLTQPINVGETERALVKKTIVFDGRETIQFNIQDELNFHRGESSIQFNKRVYIIKAEITETLTGLSKSAEKTITVHQNTYKITTDLMNKTLQQDSTANVKVDFIKFRVSLQCDLGAKIDQRIFLHVGICTKARWFKAQHYRSTEEGANCCKTAVSLWSEHI